MLVMLRPGGDLWTPVTLLLLAGVAGMAISRTMTRVLATTETPECLTFWLMAFHMPVGVLLLAVGFPMPGVDATVVIAMLVLGISNGVAHWLHARASALAPVGALAPYEYIGMIWACCSATWLSPRCRHGPRSAVRRWWRCRHRQFLPRAPPPPCRTGTGAGGGIAVAAPALAQRNDQ